MALRAAGLNPRCRGLRLWQKHREPCGIRHFCPKMKGGRSDWLPLPPRRTFGFWCHSRTEWLFSSKVGWCLAPVLVLPAVLGPGAPSGVTLGSILVSFWIPWVSVGDPWAAFRCLLWLLGALWALLGSPWVAFSWLSGSPGVSWCSLGHHNGQKDDKTCENKLISFGDVVLPLPVYPPWRTIH